MDNQFLILGLIVIALLLIVVYMQRRNTVTGQSGSSVPFRLLAIDGPLRGKQFVFRQKSLSIGRDAQNDIVVNSDLVSRFHAVVTFVPQQGLVLQDSDSTNGTWMQGQRVGSVPLAPNSTFQIGPVIFSVMDVRQPVPELTSVAQSPLPSAPVSGVVSKPVVTPPVQAVNLGDYERQELLGEGGAATVYRCIHRQSGEVVAIKVLHNSADPYFKQKFGAEGRVGQQLNHPHIVRTLGYGKSGNLDFIILDFMPGGSLRQRLSNGSVPVPMAVNVVGQMCMALEYAHRRGVFHRDLKPENILFADDNTARLSDFGIARFTSMVTVTAKGMLVGTPQYMSFEQAKGAEIDGRSDQYALAIVLYEMITGVCPFMGEALTVVGKHLSENPISPRKLNPAIPAGLESAILRALEKPKQKRFENMLGLARAIGYQPAPEVVRATTAVHAAPAEAREMPVIASLSPVTAMPRAVLANAQTGQQFFLPPEGREWGREQLQDSRISRRHAAIWQQNGQFYIKDLGSVNGTTVNGQPAHAPVPLTHGCSVCLGPVQFQFLNASPATL